MTTRSQAEASRAGSPGAARPLAAAAGSLWLLLLILLGGTSQPSANALAFQSVSSVIVIVLCLWQLRGGFPTTLAALGAALLLSCFAVTFLQLIPLPPSLWSAFPGREFQVRMLETLGVALPWQPVTLSLAATKGAALALLPAAAGFLLALATAPPQRVWLVAAVVASAFVGLFVGLMQQLQGAESSFYFYGNLSGVVSGTFGNRNFFAAHLYASIPFVAALAAAAQQRFRLPNWLVAIFALTYVGVMIIGLAGTASRAGTLLSMVAVILAAAVVYRPQNWGRAGGVSRSVTLAALGVLLLLSQVGMAAILRFAETDLADMRGQIFEVSWGAAKAFFPVGSGFGSFVPVYQMFEVPSIMIAQYVNHAHNDWLELLLEGGAAAALLILLFLLLYVTSAARLLRLEFASPGRAYLRAAGVVILLLLLHGFVDFGLRTPALLVIFSLSCGFVTLGAQSVSETRARSRQGARGNTPPPPPPRSPGMRPIPKFGAPRAGEQPTPQGEASAPTPPAPPRGRR